MSTPREQRAAALERWADEVTADELVVADTGALRVIAELVERPDEADAALPEAIRSAQKENITRVTASLRCVIPRWALSSDPHISVNDATPIRLDKAPTTIEILPGMVRIAAAPWPADLTGNGVQRRVTALNLNVDPGAEVRVSFRPAFHQSWNRRGRLVHLTDQDKR